MLDSKTLELLTTQDVWIDLGDGSAIACLNRLKVPSESTNYIESQDIITDVEKDITDTTQ